MAGRPITKNLLGFAKFGLIQGALLGILFMLLSTVFASLLFYFLPETTIMMLTGLSIAAFFVLLVSSVIVWVINGLIFNGVFTGRIKQLNLSCTSPLVSASILALIGSAFASSWLGWIIVVFLTFLTLEIFKLLKWKQPFSGG